MLKYLWRSDAGGIKCMSESRKGGEEEPLAGAWAGVEGSGEHRLVDWSKTIIYSSLQVVETATLTRTVAMYTTSDNT